MIQVRKEIALSNYLRRREAPVQSKISPLHIQTVTGMNKWVAVWLTGGVCIFYTSLGGLNAVVWTDTFQVIFFKNIPSLKHNR